MAAKNKPGVMPKTRLIICECGGEIDRPIPARCPHCGSPIVRVRHTTASWLVPVLVIGGVFGGLVAALIFLTEP
ncbi:MAG: hypothetical protein VX988_08290 [Planctomycetota bacterium]|nr:hypothetical protein [Planctomycetota bacterium]